MTARGPITNSFSNKKFGQHNLSTAQIKALDDYISAGITRLDAALNDKNIEEFTKNESCKDISGVVIQCVNNSLVVALNYIHKKLSYIDNEREILRDVLKISLMQAAGYGNKISPATSSDRILHIYAESNESLAGHLELYKVRKNIELILLRTEAKLQQLVDDFEEITKRVKDTIKTVHDQNRDFKNMDKTELDILLEKNNAIYEIVTIERNTLRGLQFHMRNYSEESRKKLEAKHSLSKLFIDSLEDIVLDYNRQVQSLVDDGYSCAFKPCFA